MLKAYPFGDPWNDSGLLFHSFTGNDHKIEWMSGREGWIESSLERGASPANGFKAFGNISQIDL